MAIKIIMLVIFFGVMIGVGVYCRKHATDVNGFVLGGRNVGPWLTAFAYGTSYFSAVIFIGYAGQFGWKFGLASTWIGLGNAFIGSLLAWNVLGRRTRTMSQHLESKTMPEFFGVRPFEDGPPVAPDLLPIRLQVFEPISIAIRLWIAKAERRDFECDRILVVGQDEIRRVPDRAY